MNTETSVQITTLNEITNQCGDAIAPASPELTNGATTGKQVAKTTELTQLGEDFRNAYDELQSTTTKLQAAYKKSVGEAIYCGQLLIKAKKLAGHGNWLPWLASHAKISAKTAQRYMQLADNASELGELTEKSLVDCYAALGLINKPDAEEETAPAASNDATTPDECSDFIQAKKLVIRLSELLQKTTDKKRMSEVIKPTIAWHDDYLAEVKKKNDMTKIMNEAFPASA